MVNSKKEINNSENILGYFISTMSKNQCINEILNWIENGSKGKYFVCANPHSLEVAKTDQIFAEAIKNADLIVPDGIGIVMASRILGGAIRDRVTGSDIFWELSNRLNEKNGFSFFFLGSTEEDLVKIKDRMNQVFPNIKVAGIYSPPFRREFSEEENSVMREAINRVEPDVLWIGMTAPKQEKWIYKNKSQLNVKFIGAIGAAFDFFTGHKKRSPIFFQRIGFEWLPRFLQEPRRLWRRNLVSNPRFLFRVIHYKLNLQ